MKIGLLTFHRSKNYGGALQTFALYTTLKQLGHSVNIIDYWPTYRKGMQSTFPINFWKLSLLKKIKAIVRYVLTIKNLNTRHKKFNEFITKHFGIGKYPKYSNGAQITEQFDVCVYGSDQIWRNYKLDGFKGIDETYFGKYPTYCKTKVSYAASMGEINLKDTEKEKFKNLLKNFDSISVRELTLKNFIQVNFKIDPFLACDPTFLLSKNDWLKIIPSSIKSHGKRYIFYYNLMPSILGKKLSQFISDFYNIELIELPQTPLKSLFGNRLAGIAGPLEFLNLIYNADFVVSSSFHGVAFSILLEKQFFAVGMGNKADRAITALTTLNLKNRFINKIEDIDLKNEIDYTITNQLLSKYREESNSYLLESLKLS